MLVLEWKTSNKTIEYRDASDFMENRVNQIIDHRSEELIWFLEHPPIYTAGTSAKKNELLKSQFPIYQTGRGGKFTYHGPGQLIVYLMLNLKKRKMKSVKQYVYKLEQVIIDTLQDIGIIGAHRINNKIGVWIKNNSAVYKKIAAIGIRIKKWITYHGFSLNIEPDLTHYQGIIPCGIKDYGITSISDLGYNSKKNTMIKLLKKHISTIFYFK
ncbi:MAG: lipoyl(octanoyl) transferase LipB [Rickettsiaceae bacterium H1]|nr:lipoyl(octanoyl) transferase LipB [Rickettsiaceae bacterium H1]